MLYENGKECNKISLEFLVREDTITIEKDNPWLKAYRISFLDNDEKNKKKLLDGVLIRPK